MSVQIIDNIEVGQIPDTPSSVLTIPTLHTAEASLLGTAREFGFPIGYAQEQNGKVIQHVFPVKGTEKEQISSSSKVDLELHTETAFHPYKPDYVMLLCLKGDSNAATTYACLEDILGNIEPEIAHELTKEQFYTTIDKSFRMNGEPDVSVKTAILQKDKNGYIKLNFDSSVMHGDNSAANHALSKLKSLISDNVKEFTLQKGQLAIIDNKATVHGRKHFSPRYDGTDRWLMRCMVIKELPPTQFVDGNVITFSDFGSID